MKKKTKDAIRNSTRVELAKKAAELRVSIAKSTGERYTKQPKNSRAIIALRRELGIVLTVSREKELTEEATHE